MTVRSLGPSLNLPGVPLTAFYSMSLSQLVTLLCAQRIAGRRLCVGLDGEQAKAYSSKGSRAAFAGFR